MSLAAMSVKKGVSAMKLPFYIKIGYDDIKPAEFGDSFLNQVP